MVAHAAESSADWCLFTLWLHLSGSKKEANYYRPGHDGVSSSFDKTDFIFLSSTLPSSSLKRSLQDPGITCCSHCPELCHKSYMRPIMTYLKDFDSTFLLNNLVIACILSIAWPTSIAGWTVEETEWRSQRNSQKQFAVLLKSNIFLIIFFHES